MEDNSSKTVLVVDDDPDLRTIAEMILTEAGFRVTTAEHGKAALEAVNHGLPSVILLDIKMPVMDGPEFARQFRARYGEKIPIVVVTAAESAARWARDIGAQGWLGKPFELDELVDVVRRSLDG